VEVLERMLEEYKGSLLVVSHDRSFLDHVVDFLFVLEGAGTGTVQLFNGEYTEVGPLCNTCGSVRH
jgi:ATPase subunit of ABC transporter with duplicated ATPase domains